MVARRQPRRNRHQVIDVVEVLRRTIRGQAVTAQEAAALAAHTRPVRGPTIPNSVIKRELAGGAEATRSLSDVRERDGRRVHVKHPLGKLLRSIGADVDRPVARSR